MSNPSQPRNRADASREAQAHESNMARSRESRETREFVPAGELPEPRPEPGYKLRWVRTSIHDHQDITNVHKAMREGWVPCARADHPELSLVSLAGLRNDAPSGNEIIIGGLMLMKRPVELCEAETRYYERQTNAQISGVESMYKQHAKPDARMPIEFSHNSNVTFGSGDGSDT